MQFKTRMIELASEINAEMPAYVVRKAADALNERSKAVKGTRVLVLGVAYKKNIGDLRESPALDIIRLLQEKGASVQFHDPHVDSIADDGHTLLKGLPLHSVPLTDAFFGKLTTRPPGQCASVPARSVQPQTPTVEAPARSTRRPAAWP